MATVFNTRDKGPEIVKKLNEFASELEGGIADVEQAVIDAQQSASDAEQSKIDAEGFKNQAEVAATNAANDVRSDLEDVRDETEGFRDETALIKADFETAFGGLSYLAPVEYDAGIDIDSAVKTVEYDGEVYAPLPSEVPFTTSGTFETDKFRLIQGVTTQQMASTAAGGFAANIGRNVVAVDSIADLMALPAGARRGDLRYLVKEDAGKVGGREFYWSQVNLSLEVSADTEGLIYVAPSGDPTGASGAWVLLPKYRTDGPLPGFSRNNYAIGVSESSSIGSSWNYTKLAQRGFLSSIPTKNNAWLAAADTFQWVEAEMPFAVIIGDSIAEGHGSPDRHGRLHTGASPIYDLDLPNVPGQPAYHLAEKTGIYWYNHGIGGQTSSQVWARWMRDALAQDFDVGDGRPTVTLPRKPYAVWVNVGINDISTGVPLSVTKINLIKMAVSARDSGIIIGFNTCGPNVTHNSEQVENQKALQQWMLNELPGYGAYVFDFRAWFGDPANPDVPNPQLRADNVHPSGAGYLSYSSELVNQSGAPIVLNSICVESKVDPDSPPASYTPPTGVRVEHVASGLDSVGRLRSGECRLSAGFDMTNTRTLRFYVCDTLTFPISGSNRSAISRIYGEFSSGPANNSQPERSAFATFSHNTGSGFSVLTSYPRRDVIDVAIISGNLVRVRFTRPVADVKVAMHGNSLNYVVIPSLSTSPRRDISFFVIDSSTGDVVDPTALSSNFFFSVSAR